MKILQIAELRRQERKMKQGNAYPLRLEETLTKKLKALASEHNRSYNKEIEYILKNYMKQYEEENGPVFVEEEN